MSNLLQCGDKAFDLSKPRIMGILNVTPDSFSDGGLFIEPEKALEHARQMVAEGAAIIDVGGESTRPGAQPVSTQQELDRVIPVIELIANELDCIISIDTSKAEVMRAAINAGAHIINDVYALRAEGAIARAVELDVPVCLMHMQGEPRSMQNQPEYDDVVDDVKQFLLDRAQDCVDYGMRHENIIIDPGFGFGKTVEQNYRLLHYLHTFVTAGFPVLVGVSKKSMIGAIIDREADDRTAASIALATMAYNSGVRLFRVHDVRATADALMMCEAIANTN